MSQLCVLKRGTLHQKLLRGDWNVREFTWGGGRCKKKVGVEVCCGLNIAQQQGGNGSGGKWKSACLGPECSIASRFRDTSILPATEVSALRAGVQGEGKGVPDCR